jgi:hypothetical protein
MSPTESDQAAQDIEIRSHVLAHPKLYKSAGKHLDKVYSPEACQYRKNLGKYFPSAWYDEATNGRLSASQLQTARKKKKVDGRKDRRDGWCYTPVSVASAFPSFKNEIESRLKKREVDDLWQSAANRVHEAVSDLLKNFEIHRTIPPLDVAARVVLLHWILTDQSCNTAPVITELQDWSYLTVHHSLPHTGNAGVLSSREDWRVYVHRAFAVMQKASRDIHTGVHATSRSAPMSKNELARRIQNDRDARPRQVNWDLYGLQSHGNKYTVCLDGMDLSMRARIEKPDRA